MGKDYSTEKYYLGLVPLLVKNYLKISPVVHLTSQRNAAFRWIGEKHNLNYLPDLTFQLLLPVPVYFSIEESSRLTKIFCASFEVELKRKVSVYFRHIKLEENQ